MVNLAKPSSGPAPKLDKPSGAKPSSSDVQVIEHFDGAKKAITKESRKKIFLAANLVKNNLISVVLVGTRSGRQYTVPGTKRKYTASAPGQAPASRVGDLRRSYSVLPKDVTKIQDKAAVGSSLPYADMLEKGTRNIAPRPHLSTAFANVKDEMAKLLTGNWDL